MRAVGAGLAGCPKVCCLPLWRNSCNSLLQAALLGIPTSAGSKQDIRCPFWHPLKKDHLFGGVCINANVQNSPYYGPATGRAARLHKRGSRNPKRVHCGVRFQFIFHCLFRLILHYSYIPYNPPPPQPS